MGREGRSYFGKIRAIALWEEKGDRFFKKVGNYWSVRAGQAYRALGVEIETGILWFWIGTHAEYDRLIGK
jgi:hypothetical protein